MRADVPPNILTAGREPALLFPFSHPTPRFQRGFQTRAILGSAPCPCLPRASPSPQAKPERVRGSMSQSHKSTHHADITLSSPYTNPHSLVWTCVHTDTASVCAKWQTQAPREHSVLGGPQGWREAEDAIWVLGGSQAQVVYTLTSTHRPEEASLETFTKAHPFTELLLYTLMPISSLNPFYNPLG